MGWIEVFRIFLAKFMINLRIFSPFQNFDSIPHVSSLEVGYYGGSVALADYCPYIQVSQISLSEGNSHLRLIMQEFTWRSNNVVVRGSHCAYTENQPSESPSN